MKIAISAALVLGMAHYTAAFPCYWNGGGSSYVYDYTFVCGRDGNCITCIDNRQAQSTCCRCVLASSIVTARKCNATQNDNP
jgi:hypothetical protein